MTPKAITFGKEAVLEAAVAVVRHEGLGGLSARAVAASRAGSTRPAKGGAL